MKIKDLLEGGNKGHGGKGSFLSIGQEGLVPDTLKQMADNGVSALVVMDGADGSNGPRAVGIFTERDLVRCYTLFCGRTIDGIKIKDVMTTALIVAEPEDTVETAMAMMIRAKIRHLPVVGDKQIIGMINLEDLVKVHVGALTQELHYLKDYISDLQDAAHD